MTILSTHTFAPVLVDPATVGFGPKQADPLRVAYKDVNREGRLDLLLYFRAKETGIKRRDPSASLAGETFGGLLITGTDTFGWGATSRRTITGTDRQTDN